MGKVGGPRKDRGEGCRGCSDRGVLERGWVSQVVLFLFFDCTLRHAGS